MFPHPDASPLKDIFTWKKRGTGQELAEVKQEKYHPALVRPADELREWRYVSANKYRCAIILVDVDSPPQPDRDGFLSCFDEHYYESLGLPLPNFAVLSHTRPGAFHALWALSRPVSKYNAAVMRYYKRVRLGLTHALSGDPACGWSTACKNPFYHAARVRCFTWVRYELAELEMPLPEELRRSGTARSPVYEVGNRNWASFQRACLLLKERPELDLETLLARIETFQAEHEAPSLDRPENLSIAKSALRKADAYYVDDRNRGAMDLPPLKEALSAEDFRHWRAYRQAMGAEYARCWRTGKCYAALDQAVVELYQQGLPITISSLARTAGVHRQTVRRYYQYMESMLQKQTGT